MWEDNNDATGDNVPYAGECRELCDCTYTECTLGFSFPIWMLE
jgi:hypothetical protein